MPGTRQDMKKLRQRKNEIGNLRNEEQQSCFTEVAKNSYYRYRHPRKITECVTNKNTSWVPKINKILIHGK